MSLVLVAGLKRNTSLKLQLQSISDETLIEKIGNRDELAFEELCRRYLKWAYRFDMRFLQDSREAEDAVQEKFLRIWKKAESFEIREGSKASNFILKIDKNICLDIVSRNAWKRETAISSESLDSTDDGMEVFLDYLAFSHRTDSLAESLLDRQIESRDLMKKIYDFTRNSFSSRQFVSFWGFVTGMSYNEIAGTYGMKPGAVRGLIARAFSSIRREFAREMD